MKKTLKKSVCLKMFVMCQEEELTQIDFKSQKDSQKDFTKGGISNQTVFFFKKY